MGFEDNIEGFSDGEEPLHFFYNREDRISRAPKIVQDYYAGKLNCQKKGLFKTMFANKGNRFMFAGIVVFMAFIWIYSLISQRNSHQIAGTTGSFSAFSYEENVYASLKLEKVKLKDGQTFVPVNISVNFNFYDKDNLLVDEKKEFSVYDGNELFVRTKCEDLGINKVSAEIFSNNEQIVLDSLIERH